MSPLEQARRGFVEGAPLVHRMLTAGLRYPGEGQEPINQSMLRLYYPGTSPGSFTTRHFPAIRFGVRGGNSREAGRKVGRMVEEYLLGRRDKEWQDSNPGLLLVATKANSVRRAKWDLEERGHFGPYWVVAGKRLPDVDIVSEAMPVDTLLVVQATRDAVRMLVFQELKCDTYLHDVMCAMTPQVQVGCVARVKLCRG